MQPLFNYSTSVGPLLPTLRSHLPQASFRRYLEPFLGSGAMFLSLPGGHESLLCEKCRPLMLIHRYVKNSDPAFICFASAFLGASRRVFSNMYGIFDDLYDVSAANRRGFFAKDYKSLVESVNGVSDGVTFAELFPGLDPSVGSPDFKLEKRHQILQEVLRQEKAPELDAVSFESGLLYAMQASVYGFVHSLMERDDLGDEVRAAALLYLLCVNPPSGARVGDIDFPSLNLPFGEKEGNPLLSPGLPARLKGKIGILGGEELPSRFAGASLFTGDGLERLISWDPSPEDFIFLDPPREVPDDKAGVLDYTAFKSENLAVYLLHECPSRWMVLLDEDNSSLACYRDMRCRIYHLRGTSKVLILNYCPAL